MSFYTRFTTSKLERDIHIKLSELGIAPKILKKNGEYFFIKKYQYTFSDLMNDLDLLSQDQIDDL